MEESIQHLFLNFYVAKLMWRALYCAFGIVPPSSVGVADLFGAWSSFSSKFQSTILIGAVALCWTIWIRRDWCSELLAVSYHLVVAEADFTNLKKDRWPPW